MPILRVAPGFVYGQPGGIRPFGSGILESGHASPGRRGEGREGGLLEVARRRRERRVTFRVSVKPSSGLEASLRIQDQEWPADISDISAEGIFVTPREGAEFDLEVDSQVNVELMLKGQTVRLSGVIRLRREGGYGIHFPRRDAEGYRNPMNRLSRIVMRLQLKSLAGRRLSFLLRSR